MGKYYFVEIGKLENFNNYEKQIRVKYKLAKMNGWKTFNDICFWEIQFSAISRRIFVFVS